MTITKRNKVLLICAVAAGVLLALVLGAGLWLESKADGMLKKEFSKMTGGKYKLELGGVDVSLINRSVTLNDLSIMPDSAIIAAQDASEQSKTSVSFSAKEVFLAGINYKTKDGGKINLGIRRLKISSPAIKYRKSGKQDRGKAVDETGSDTIGVRPIKLDIGKIIISEGYVEHSHVEDNDTLRNVIEGLAFETDKFFVETPQGSDDRLLVGDDTRLFIAKFRHMPADESNYLEVDSLSISTMEKSVRIASFGLIPTYEKEVFSEKSWMHKDWMKLVTGECEFFGVDFDRLFNEKAIHVDSISVEGPDIRSYKDRNVIREEWIKPLYHQQIQRLPFKFSVRKVGVRNMYAQYEEKSPGADKAGIVHFGNIACEISGITNIVPAAEPFWTLAAKGNLADEGPFDAKFFIPIDSTTNRFEITCTTGQTGMVAYNEMIEPLVGVRVEGGVVNRLTFHITCTMASSTIDMTMLYSDLKIAVEKEKDGEIHDRKLISFLANELVLRGDNPGASGTPRTVHTTAERDPYRSPWNFLWRSIYSGVKETIGL